MKTKQYIKNLCWKVPMYLLWYTAANEPFKGISIWESILWSIGIILCFDLIRWGLKNE